MNIVKAVSFKVASTLMFAVMGAQVRYLAGAYPEGQVAFFRSVFALIPILVVFGWRGQLKGALRTERPSDHLLRGVFSVVGTFATFAALARIPIADFTAIAFASPLITVIFAAVFLINAQLGVVALVAGAVLFADSSDGVQVMIGLGIGHRRHVAADAHLTAKRLPVK